MVVDDRDWPIAEPAHFFRHAAAPPPPPGGDPSAPPDPSQDPAGGPPDPSGGDPGAPPDPGAGPPAAPPAPPLPSGASEDGTMPVKGCPFCGSANIIAQGDGTIKCNYDQNIFTVRLMPTLPMAPGFIHDAIPAPPGAASGAPGAGAPESFGGDSLSDKMEKPDGDPADKAPAPDDDKGDDDKGGDKPPWLDKKSMLITEQGIALTPDAYIAHLAIKHSINKSATIDEVKAKRFRTE